MSKMASFFHNPTTGDVRVWDLTGHDETRKKLRLDNSHWREGYYLPNGTVDCRVSENDNHDGEYYNKRLKRRFPTFYKFFNWALIQEIKPVTTLELYECKYVSEVMLPGSLTTLELWYCGDVSGMMLPDNLTMINIRDCDNVSGLEFPASLATLCILDCGDISRLKVPGNITTIEIKKCDNISWLKLTPSLTTLCIWDCDNVSGLELPDSLTTLNILNCGDGSRELKKQFDSIKERKKS